MGIIYSPMRSKTKNKEKIIAIFIAIWILLFSFHAHASPPSPICYQTSPGVCSTVSTSNGLPISIYDAGNNAGSVYTSNGSSSPATFQNYAYGLYGMPLEQSSAIHSYGDSITACAYVTTSTCYPYYLGTMMQATVTDYAVSGDQSCDMSTRVFLDDATGPSDAVTGPNPIYSTAIGTNDANVKGLGAYEAIYNNCLTSSLLWLSIPSNYKVNATTWTQTGTWGTGNTGQPTQAIYSDVQGSTATGTITTYGGPLYFVYALSDNWTGTFTYSVDGGAASAPISSPSSPLINTQNGGIQGEFYVEIDGLAAGTHTLEVVVTSASSTNAYVEPVFIGTVPPNPQWGGPQVWNLGVLPQQYNANAALTLGYNNDAKADAAKLAAKGLQVYFAPVRNYIVDATDWANSFHPNATGQLHMAQGWAANMQPIAATTNLFMPLSSTFFYNQNTTNPVGLGLHNTNTQGYQGIAMEGDTQDYWSAVGNSASNTPLIGNFFIFDYTTGKTGLVVNSNGQVGVGDNVGTGPGSGGASGCLASGYDFSMCGVVGVDNIAEANTSAYFNTNINNAQSTTLLNPGIMLYSNTSNVFGMDLGWDNSGAYATRIFTGPIQDIVFSKATTTPTAQTSFTDLVRITTAGNLSTTSISQGTAVNCAAGVVTNSAGTFSGCVASDIRLKKDVNDLAYDPSIISNLHPVTFRYKDPDARDADLHGGFIAQEVQKIYPAAVTGGGKDGMLSVDPNAISAAIVLELQHQQQEISLLEHSAGYHLHKCLGFLPWYCED